MKTKEKRITRNAVRCLKCGETIESRFQHEMVWCKCHTIAVDGGKAYLRRVGDLDCYENLSTYA